MASKMGIAVGGGVIDADYTGEVNVILRNHGEADCVFKAGDRIAQLIVENVANADAMEVDDLGITERGKMGFGSSDMNSKRSITAKEEKVRICFLHADTSGKEFFSAADITYHPRLTKEREMLSSAHVNAALTRTINDTFLDKIRAAGNEDEKWLDRGRELVRLRERKEKSAGRMDRKRRVAILQKSVIDSRKRSTSDRDSPRVSRLVSSWALWTGKND